MPEILTTRRNFDEANLRNARAFLRDPNITGTDFRLIWARKVLTRLSPPKPVDTTPCPAL